MTRTPIRTVGRRGASCRVYGTTLNGEAVTRCEWREQGASGSQQTKTFRGPKRDRDAAALAWADGVVARMTGVAAPKAVRRRVGELWAAYVTAHESDWRPKTLSLARSRWKVWALFLDPHTYADLVQPEMLDAWRVALLANATKRGQPMARNQVAHHIQLVKSVWRFARQRRLIAENPLGDYAVKKGRDYGARQIEEYTGDEWARILRQLDCRKALQWRAHCAIGLDGLLGTRSRALLALTWADVDLARRIITWPGALDKVGRTRVQPLPRDAVRLLRIARVWAHRDGYDGPFVLYSPQQRTRYKSWTYAALNAALHAAAERAGVKRIPFRAMHSLRRMAGNDALAATGDITKVGQWLGDSDLRVLQRSYLRDRPDDLVQVVAASRLPPRHRSADEVPTKGLPTTSTATGTR